MERVTGIGGVFFRAQDPAALRQWYVDHLGVPAGKDDDPTVMFSWTNTTDAGGNPDSGHTVWAPFATDTDYFGRRDNQWMVNFRVRDLDAMLDQLRQAGAVVHDEVEELDGVGRFGWFDDPEGNRIELWQPAPGM